MIANQLKRGHKFILKSDAEQAVKHGTSVEVCIISGYDDKNNYVEAISLLDGLTLSLKPNEEVITVHT